MGVGKELAEFYKGKRVFVTGHTGFKGSWLLLWLHKLGAIVKGYSLKEADDSLYRLIHGDDFCDSVIGDIRDARRIEKEIERFNPDIIFHLAAQAIVKEGYLFPLETFEVNVMGTLNLLSAVRNLRGWCSIVVITTDKVYENIESKYAYSENDKLGGYDPYSASKAAAEIAVDSFRNSFFNTLKISEHKKAIATVRAGNVIGGGDRSKERLMPDIIHSLEEGAPVIVRNPDAIRPWQHVLEPLYGYLVIGMMLEQDPLRTSGAFNFGPELNDTITVEELVQKAIEFWGKGSYVIKKDPHAFHEAGILMLNNKKAKDHLGIIPKFSIGKSVEKTIYWYKEAKGNYVEFSLMQIEQYINESL